MRFICCSVLLMLCWGKVEKTTAHTAPAPSTEDPIYDFVIESVVEPIVQNAYVNSIALLQQAIPVTEEQVEQLLQEPQVKQLIKDNRKIFKTWWSKQNFSQQEKQAAMGCFTQTPPKDAHCKQNPIFNFIGDMMDNTYQEANNHSIQYALNHQWIPANEKGSQCKDVRKGHFYYYPTADHDEVAYIHRTDSTQQESRDGTIKKRHLVWYNDCEYSISALEEDNDFKMDFEIVHVASDHYLYLRRLPSREQPTKLLLGRVNKSLE